MTRSWKRSVPHLAILLTLACGDAANDPTPLPAGDTITYTLQGATTGLGGVSLRLIASGMDTSTIAFRTGSVHLLRVGGDTLSVALFGVIDNGELLTLRVASAGDLADFTAVVVEAVGPDDGLVPTGPLTVAVRQR